MPTRPLRRLVLSVTSLTSYNTRLVLRRPIAEGFNRTFRQLHPALRSFTVLYAPEPDFTASSTRPLVRSQHTVSAATQHVLQRRRDRHGIRGRRVGWR